MHNEFERNAGRYEELVRESISFSGVSLDFAVYAKAVLVREIVGAHFGVPSQVRLLDIGCGLGLIHRSFREFGWQVTGVDVAAEPLRIAQDRNPGVRYERYSGGETPFPGASFDVTLAICVMHHVAPAEWLSFLAEMKRVTRRNGLAIVIEHNRWNPLTRLAVARCELDADARLVPARTLYGLMQEIGLRPGTPAYFLATPFKARLFRNLERLLQTVPLGAQYCLVGTA